VTRDRKGQTFVPGFLTAVWHTPVISEGHLPGGGELFASCTRAAEVAGEQLPLLDRSVCPKCHAEQKPGERVNPDGSCASCLPPLRLVFSFGSAVIHRTRNDDEKA
jgi:hypothetical protein